MGVVAVTGASSGVGRAAAREFGARGCAVALMARNADALKAAACEVEDAGGTALVLPLDIARWDEVDDAASEIERSLGPIGVWVNDAMVSVYSPVSQLEPAEVARVMEVNYLGTVHGTLAALHRMQPRNRGVIVQVGSGLAYRAIPLQAPYCASKHAVRAFTESLRTELLRDRSRVRITIVELPGLNTPHFTRVRTRLPRAPRPVAPIYSAAMAGRSIVYAADHPRREHVVGGSTALTILSQKLMPGAIDRVLARTGWAAQMTDEATAFRPGNLFDPLPDDPGAEGPFIAEARARSLHWFVRRHRTAIAVMGVTGGGLRLLLRRG